MSWSGMRGAVSLAMALAVPLSTQTGDPFPGRDLILFLTFSVILATLVLQGLTLGPLISFLLSLLGAGEGRPRTPPRYMYEGQLTRLATAGTSPICRIFEVARALLDVANFR